MAPVLGYWDIRGLGESIRYMLHYLGIKFEDKRYAFGPAPKWIEGPWTEEKHTLGLALPNLPYYIDGDLKLSQSGAIMRYLARTKGLYYPEGQGDDVNQFDMMEGHVKDFQMSAGWICYNPKYEEALTLFEPRILSSIKDTSSYLADKPWIMGDQISHIDFMLFEVIDLMQKLIPNCLEGLDNLTKYMDRFAAIPSIQKYRETSPKWPFFSPMASFGGKGDPPQLI